MGSDVTSDRIRMVLGGVLAPLAQTLLRCGVSYSEFADLSKRAFVEAASTGYGVRNRPTNIARVAVMTGLPRKEVSRIRREIEKCSKRTISTRNLPSDVLHRWHTDPVFLDSSGIPKALQFAGQAVSFSQLVRAVTTDIPPKTMQRELSRVGAIRIQGKKLLPITREFVPAAATERLMEGLQYGLCRLVETISHNANPENRRDYRFQRVVHVSTVKREDLQILRDSLAAILGTFAVRMDDYLTSFENAKPKGREQGETCDVGIGLYYFDGSG